MAATPTLVPAHQRPDLSSLCLAITERAPFPMVTVQGASHIVRYVNPAFCQLMDKPSEQLVGIPFGQMLPEKDQCLALLDRVFYTGKSESHTEQKHSKPHPAFWSFTMWPVLAEERPVGVMIQVTETAQFHEKTLAMNEALMLGSLRQSELTEESENLNKQLRVEIVGHKRTAEALSESQDRFRAIAENIPQLAWMADREGNVDWFNRGWLEYTGTTLQENLGAGWKAVHHPDYVDAVAEKFERHLREGLDWEDTFPLRGKDGNYRWFLSRMNVIRDESGKVMRFFGTNTDVTDLRVSEERYRTLFAAAPMAVFVCDRNAVIQQYNQRAVEFWGREPTCGVEQHCGSVKLWLPDGTLLPHAQSPMIDVLRTGVPARNVEVFIERPDGSRLPVLVNFAALRNGKGEITGAITSFMDITERKQAEERQRLLTNELAHRGKNLLAVVLSIAFRSLSGKRSLTEARDVLIQRLHALARSQSMLISEGFEGAPPERDRPS